MGLTVEDRILTLPCTPCGAVVAVIYIAPTHGDRLDPPQDARWDYLVPPSSCDCVVSDGLMAAAIEAVLRPAHLPLPLADLPR